MEAYRAEYDGIRGLDIIAFSTRRFNEGGRWVERPIVIFHESKGSDRPFISAGTFRSKLGRGAHGRQQSLGWLNYVLHEMEKDTRDDHTKWLAAEVRGVLDSGGYFVRTGNLRVNFVNSRGDEESMVQFYLIADKKTDEGYEADRFRPGMFLNHRRGNFYSSSRDLAKRLKQQDVLGYLQGLFR
jgi:hypothetical protein